MLPVFSLLFHRCDLISRKSLIVPVQDWAGFLTKPSFVLTSYKVNLKTGSGS